MRKKSLRKKLRDKIQNSLIINLLVSFVLTAKVSLMHYAVLTFLEILFFSAENTSYKRKQNTVYFNRFDNFISC